MQYLAEFRKKHRVSRDAATEDELSEADAAGRVPRPGEVDGITGRAVLDGGSSIEGHHRLVIAGSGIVGLTAVIYAGRSNNDPLVLEGAEPGGQLTLTTDVANYPGFPEGINGPELIQRMKEQAARFGATFEHGVIDRLDDSVRSTSSVLTGTPTRPTPLSLPVARVHGRSAFRAKTR